MLSEPGFISELANPAVAGVIVGAALPSMAQSGGSARHARSAAQLRMIGMAVMNHAQDRQGLLPADLGAIVDAGLIEQQMLNSPFGDGTDQDIVYLGTADLRLDDLETFFVIAYDDAALRNTGRTMVLFADGHVESMPRERLDEALKRSAEKGVRR
jgi:prepilin-type processing-associated H-X9-DG protein